MIKIASLSLLILLYLSRAAFAGSINGGNIVSPYPQVESLERCPLGFSGKVAPNLDADEEKKCDQDNLDQFQIVFGCSQRTMSFDLDHDGCATCKDFFLWKERIKDLYLRKSRKTNGDDLAYPYCNPK